MLDALKSKAAQESRIITIVGPGTAVEGRLSSTGPIRVEGRVVGHLQSEEQIMVLASGRVKADIDAKHVVISGEVEGDVTATERMEITRGAKLIGNISAPRISIDEGVLFEGRCSMHSPDMNLVLQASDAVPKVRQTAATAQIPPDKQSAVAARNTIVSRDPATKSMEEQLNLDEATDVSRKSAAPAPQRSDKNTASINNSAKQNRSPAANSNSPRVGQKSVKQNKSDQSSAPADNEKPE